MRVVLAVGTRPEATKMAPVYLALQEGGRLGTYMLLTGQHREQLIHGLEVFGIAQEDAHIENLDLMTERQTLTGLSSRLVGSVGRYLNREEPDYLLVHGDTLTTFCVAWAGFLKGIPVGHVEAGLRSGSLKEPFPEEANRRLTDILVDLCFAPTPETRDNLISEGRASEEVVVTGQTGVDAVLYAARKGTRPDVGAGPFVTVTLHRRENWEVLGEMAEALASVARNYPEYTFVYPVHLNPKVREVVYPVLSDVRNFRLIDPLEYSEMAALLADSELIVTDSGGLQEEGAALGVPVVVARNLSERPEGLRSGILRLGGRDPNKLQKVVAELLDDDPQRENMAQAPNPYGDGEAGERVARFVEWRLDKGPRPDEWSYRA